MSDEDRVTPDAGRMAASRMAAATMPMPRVDVALQLSAQSLAWLAGRPQAGCATCRAGTWRRRSFPCIVWHQIRIELLEVFSGGRHGQRGARA